jgi:uncharacterized protein (DUF1778 family)
VPRPGMVQLNVEVTPDERKLVERVAEEQGWTLGETVRRSIVSHAGLLVLHEETAKGMPDEYAAIWRRLVRELRPEGLVNKQIETVTFEDTSFEGERPGLRIDGFIFYLSANDSEKLLAVAGEPGAEQYYEVKNGALVAERTPFAPSLN